MQRMMTSWERESEAEDSSKIEKYDCAKPRSGY